MFENKNILIGVTGGIAVYKTASIVSFLKKKGANVKVIMTKAATEFVTPLTFETLSKNPVTTDMFAKKDNYDVKHIELAKWADVAFVCPATANIIGKIASGIADDMLSTVLMATKAPVLIAPAMNTGMYENPFVVENISKLKKHGYFFVESGTGVLACGDVGYGRLADEEDLIFALENVLCKKKDLLNKNILVTAGPTKENIDPVRFISNNSSGKMGYAVAKAAALRGANVTLVSGPVNINAPKGVKVISITSAEEMHKMVLSEAASSDVVVKAAAVADYRPAKVSGEKIKKGGDMKIELIQNPDILKELGNDKPCDKILVGFCMETNDLLKNAEKKLKEKNLDLICANNLFDENAGFAGDNNTITMLFKNGDKKEIPNMSKFDVANLILDEIALLLK